MLENVDRQKTDRRRSDQYTISSPMMNNMNTELQTAPKEAA